MLTRHKTGHISEAEVSFRWDLPPSSSSPWTYPPWPCWLSWVAWWPHLWPVPDPDLRRTTATTTTTGPTMDTTGMPLLEAPLLLLQFSTDTTVTTESATWTATAATALRVTTTTAETPASGPAATTPTAGWVSQCDNVSRVTRVLVTSGGEPRGCLRLSCGLLR